MPSKNIENFDILAGRVLGFLYTKFPQPITLGAELFIDFKKPNSSRSEQEKFLRKVEFFNDTVSWLADSGYIRYQGRAENSFFRAVLTAQALLALKALPASLTKGPSLGEKLSDFAKAESRAAFREVVSEALGLGAKVIGPMIGISS
jgi:hypothetical protein